MPTSLSTLKLRIAINVLAKEGYSVRQIAQKLNCARNTVLKWKDGSLEDLDIERKEGSGRKRKFNEEEMDNTEAILEEEKYSGSRRLVDRVNEEAQNAISSRTLRRYSASLGFLWGKPKRRPNLDDFDMERRVRWCITHRRENWRMYIYCDEKIFRAAVAPNGVRYRKGQRPEHKCQKYGASLHIWYAIYYDGAFPVVHVLGGLGGQEYMELLELALPGNQRDGMILLMDNASGHIDRRVGEWLDDNDFDFEDLCPNSPDLNPIENFWAIVDAEVKKRNPRNFDELLLAVTEEIGKVPRATIHSLIDSMPRRIEQCIQRRGACTDY